MSITESLVHSILNEVDTYIEEEMVFKPDSRGGTEGSVKVVNDRGYILAVRVRIPITEDIVYLRNLKVLYSIGKDFQKLRMIDNHGWYPDRTGKSVYGWHEHVYVDSLNNYSREPVLELKDIPPDAFMPFVFDRWKITCDHRQIRLPFDVVNE